MSEYEMRKKALEDFVKSDLYNMMSERQRETHMNLLVDERGLTDQIKKNRDSDYYLLHKDEIKKEKNKKVVCSICGLLVSKQNVNKHKSTKICKEVCNLLKSKNDEIDKLKKIINENNLENN